MPGTVKRAEAIHELLTAGIGGHVSRREMLRRVTGLGLSAPMIGLLLRAAPLAAKSPPAASPASDAQAPVDASSTGTPKLSTGYISKCEADEQDEHIKP